MLWESCAQEGAARGEEPETKRRSRRHCPGSRAPPGRATHQTGRGAEGRPAPWALGWRPLARLGDCGAGDAPQPGGGATSWLSPTVWPGWIPDYGGCPRGTLGTHPLPLCGKPLAPITWILKSPRSDAH
ncbi:hypothetical protein NDU88_007084 [Pleurodeles waltl]|uniref:Uncharacterized protein n=1 Tax=Pleurodeles waltl TaxID=8319 RepID=A0AAV7NUY4_PLEWA|nr:hypothetical protein NDU88_007084 [Pleurodeles waltl]